MSEIIRQPEPRRPYDDEHPIGSNDDDVDIDPALLETLQEDGEFEREYRNEHEPSEDDIVKQDR